MDQIFVIFTLFSLAFPHPAVLSEATDGVIKTPKIERTLVRPVPGKVISGFGSPRMFRGSTHAGTDFACKNGDPVIAAADGKIVWSGKSTNSQRSGIIVRIELPEAAPLASIRYLHLSATAVKVGQEVKAGEVIGYCGLTGLKQSGARLHFEVLAKDRRRADPCLHMSCE